MKDLIEALTILSKYCQRDSPTLCEHDEFRVFLDVETTEINKEDLRHLKVLGFHPDDDNSDAMISYRFGSC